MTPRNAIIGAVLLALAIVGGISLTRRSAVWKDCRRPGKFGNCPFSCSMKMELSIFVQFSRFDIKIGANELAYNLLSHLHQQYPTTAAKNR